VSFTCRFCIATVVLLPCEWFGVSGKHQSAIWWILEKLMFIRVWTGCIMLILWVTSNPLFVNVVPWRDGLGKNYIQDLVVLRMFKYCCIHIPSVGWRVRWKTVAMEQGPCQMRRCCTQQEHHASRTVHHQVASQASILLFCVLLDCKGHTVFQCLWQHKHQITVRFTNVHVITLSTLTELLVSQKSSTKVL